MAKRSGSVRELASAAGLDLEETLISLWDAGIESVGEAGDLIPTRHWRAARRALGLPNAQDYRKLGYWQQRLGLDEDEMTEILELVGIALNPKARLLPQGAPKKLRRLEEARIIAPGRPQPPLPSEHQRDVREPRLRWRSVGRAATARNCLSADDVLNIHHLLVQDFKNSDDPIDPPGLSSESLLESAVFRQHTAHGDQLKYPTAEMAAAALLHSIVNNHAFFNGNKRTALVAMAVMLFLSDLRLTCTSDEIFKVVLLTAQHRLVDRGASDRADREVLHLAEWIRSHTRRIQTGEKVVKWLKLKRILSSFDVTWEHPGGMGNRINLYRKIHLPSKSALGRRTKTLYVQVAFKGDGTEVADNTLKKIRRSLYLDMEHNYDSAVFYDHVERAEEVIIEYQSILRRLARL